MKCEYCGRDWRVLFPVQVIGPMGYKATKGACPGCLRALFREYDDKIASDKEIEGWFQGKPPKKTGPPPLDSKQRWTKVDPPPKKQATPKPGDSDFI